MENLPYAKPGTAFAIFEDAASYAALSADERHEYEVSLKAWRDQQNMIDFADA